MYFDPLSGWLVALIANGVSLANEITIGDSALAERDRERAKQSNQWLNNVIRKEKNRTGLSMPEYSYDRIQSFINTCRRSSPFKYGKTAIRIDMDNQEYIIDLLEACSQKYSQYSDENRCNKAKWFKNAANEARRRKEQYAKMLEEEAKEKQKQLTESNIYFAIGMVLVVLFVIFLISAFFS